MAESKIEKPVKFVTKQLSVTTDTNGQWEIPDVYPNSNSLLAVHGVGTIDSYITALVSARYNRYNCWFRDSTNLNVYANKSFSVIVTYTI